MASAYLADLERCQVATIVGTMFKKGLQSRFFSGLRPIAPTGGTIVGEAFTVRTVPVREDMRAASVAGLAPNMHRQALASVSKGQVIVFEGRDATDVSPLGDLIALSLVRQGVRAFITNTGVNDIPGINRVGLPVYAAGAAGIPGSARLQVVDWNVPIGLGDVSIFPGDIIVADDMGAACIPASIAQEVAKEALRQERLEIFIEEELKRGARLETTYPPDQATIARFNAWLETYEAAPSAD